MGPFLSPHIAYTPLSVPSCRWTQTDGTWHICIHDSTPLALHDNDTSTTFPRSGAITCTGERYNSDSQKACRSVWQGGNQACPALVRKTSTQNLIMMRASTS